MQCGNHLAYRSNFVHLTVKYLKYSKFGCGVNVHPTYVIVLDM
jgi:hypothetical protein